MRDIEYKKALLGYINGGYTIIEVLGGFCLAYNENAPSKFATWIWDIYPNQYGENVFSFYYGHYWNDSKLALQDLVERATAL